MIGRKCVCGLNYHLKSPSPWLTLVATIHAERKGIFTSPTAKAVFLSINVKVNEGCGPVIYMSRLILVCPR